MDAPPADATNDVPGRDANDGDPDVGVEDAEIDAPADALDDASESCELGPTMGALTVTRDLQNTRLTHPGPGPALTIAASNVMIRNVEIVLTHPNGSGIRVPRGLQNIVLDGIRVVAED